jgi:ABC-type uncharacterized transport system permease subunit
MICAFLEKKLHFVIDSLGLVRYSTIRTLMMMMMMMMILHSTSPSVTGWPYSEARGP